MDPRLVIYGQVIVQIFDFDKVIDREGTNAFAVDGFEDYLFGTPYPIKDRRKLQPLWVADMQFACPPAAIEAMHERLRHPIFGYTANFDNSLFDAFNSWCSRQFKWQVKREEMQVSLGVIPALFTLVELTCGPADKVITFSPSYGYFQKAAHYSGAQLVTSPLVKSGNDYSIDFDDFARKVADARVKLFFFCHPHNPTGRVWTPDECETLYELCKAHDVLIVSDEVHCDLRRQGISHIPLASQFPNCQNVITCMAPSKTFNLAGMMTAQIMIPDPKLRERWKQRHPVFANPLGLAAAQGAYQDGEEWLNQLRTYIDGNFNALSDFLERTLPNAKFKIPAATYLAWIDLSAYAPLGTNFTRLLLEQAGVIVEGGEMFVDNAEGMVRINVACPRSILMEALPCIESALK